MLALLENENIWMVYQVD